MQNRREFLATAAGAVAAVATGGLPLAAADAGTVPEVLTDACSGAVDVVSFTIGPWTQNYECVTDCGGQTQLIPLEPERAFIVTIDPDTRFAHINLARKSSKRAWQGK